MAFALAQAAVQSSGSGTTLTLTPGSATTVNNLVVIHLKCAGNPVTVTVTDNASVPNTYAEAVTSNAGYYAYQFYGVQITGGATIITITLGVSQTSRYDFNEFSGGAISNAAVFDVTSIGGGTSTTPSVASFNPAANGELIVVTLALASAVTVTPSAGYTVVNNATSIPGMYNLAATTTETAAATLSGSVQWIELAAAYNPLVTTPPSITYNTYNLPFLS